MFDQHICKLNTYTPDMAGFLYATMRTCPMCKKILNKMEDKTWMRFGPCGERLIRRR